MHIFTGQYLQPIPLRAIFWDGPMDQWTNKKRGDPANSTKDAIKW
jgi:hypothetical protein